MFIRSSMEEKVIYSAKGSRVEIKPGINLITNPLITIEELQGCYGTRISLVTEPTKEEIKKTKVPEKKQENKEEIKKVENKEEPTKEEIKKVENKKEIKKNKPSVKRGRHKRN